MKRLILGFILLASLVALPALATVPSTMSYQGVLTDAGGNLVPDGPYNLTFKIYTVPVAGAPIWTEVDVAVPVTKGGFSVVLGNVASLGSLAFDVKYYLGVTVAAGPELSPRVELAASPYGMSLRLPFAGTESSAGPVLSIHNGGAGAAITADPRLDVGSPTSNGRLNWYQNGSANPAGILDVCSSGGGEWALYDPAANLFSSAYNYGPDAGWFYVLTGSFFTGIGMGGLSSATTGWYGTASTANFDMGLTGDISVALPANSIDSYETLDEPGIAQGHLSVGSVSLATTMTDIVSVTITSPAAGYIVVEADGQHNAAGIGSTYNYAALQITETSGAAQDFAHYFYSGYGSVAPDGANFHPVSVRRTYYKGAGTYTFYFQGFKTQGASLSNYVFNPTITATYYPTSYGSVTEVASASEATQFSQTRQITASSDGQSAPTSTDVLVDLRELELKVARQQAALAKTQADLARAQFAAQARAQAARVSVARKP